MIIRTNLAYLRLVRGKLTQRAIADATGIGQKTLSALETGASKGIEFATLAKLCAFLKCTPDELLILEEEPKDQAVTKEAYLKANELITRGLQRAMEQPSKSAEEVWADFDRMRASLQNAAEENSVMEQALAQIESKADSRPHVLKRLDAMEKNLLDTQQAAAALLMAILKNTIGARYHASLATTYADDMITMMQTGNVLSEGEAERRQAAREKEAQRIEELTVAQALSSKPKGE